MFQRGKLNSLPASIVSFSRFSASSETRRPHLAQRQEGSGAAPAARQLPTWVEWAGSAFILPTHSKHPRPALSRGCSRQYFLVVMSVAVVVCLLGRLVHARHCSQGVERRGRFTARLGAIDQHPNRLNPGALWGRPSRYSRQHNRNTPRYAGVLRDDGSSAPRWSRQGPGPPQRYTLSGEITLVIACARIVLPSCGTSVLMKNTSVVCCCGR